jgi:predicted site-specific integrase-resolvase
MLYSARPERLLEKKIDYRILYRWLVAGTIAPCIVRSKQLFETLWRDSQQMEG